MKQFTTKNNFFHSVFRTVCVLTFWILIWGICAALVGKDVLLPSPFAVFRRMGTLIVQKSFWISVLFSLGRVLIGYLMGCFFGILFAVLCFQFPPIDVLFSPVFSVIRSVPVASFIILALVWIGRSLVPPFISFLMVLPIIYGNVKEGLGNADQKLWEVAQVYRFRLTETYRYLYFPAALPYFQSAAYTALGMAWKSGIAAEVLCSLTLSIGGQIYASKLYLETDALMAWTITVILISIWIEKAVLRIFSRTKRRR